MKSIFLFLLVGVFPIEAQTNFSIYADELDSGFQDWSWGAHSLINSLPVHSGTNSIAFTGSAWQAISFEHADLNPAPYTSLNFWINGGPNGGQVIQIYLQYSNSFFSTTNYQLPALAGGNTWTNFLILFSKFGASSISNLSRINFQLMGSGTANAFYMDDVNLTAIVPSAVHLRIDANQILRTADSRWFGLNIAAWDGNFNTTSTSSALIELGTHILRYPGGSLADEYHWASNTTLTNTWTWATSFNSFIHIATNVGAQAIITVNYGTGISNEAAGWVRYANITNHFALKYWEIGNECYGRWETDSNNLPHDPYTYATRAAQYISAMKAADPTIKIGVPVVPGENTYSNNATHFAINPHTGATNYGWTPVVLATMKSLGVFPDFLVHHVYPQNNVDNDQSLLRASANWSGDATNLRQQISDYIGSNGTNIELLCTENNADAGNQGKQSTSLVNGLYLADSLAQLMKTEFNGFVWWDLRNGTDTSGDFNPSLYGWRTYGDLGIINGLNTRHPVFYTFKLMQFFARAGDTVLNPTSDYALLPIYCTRKADGSLAVLLINKDNTTIYNAQFLLANYLPSAEVLVRQFGIAQDEASRTNSTIPGSQDISTNYFAIGGTNFFAMFPPYSVTLLIIPPAAPQIITLPTTGGKFDLQVQGQPNTRYVLQSSTNLINWISIATNNLSGSMWNITNNLSSPQNFWRAVWLPN